MEQNTKKMNQVSAGGLQGCTCACRQFKLDPLTWGNPHWSFPEKESSQRWGRDPSEMERNSGLFLVSFGHSPSKLEGPQESPGCPEHSTFRVQPPIWLSFSLGIPLDVSYVCCRTFASAFSGKLSAVVGICRRCEMKAGRADGVGYANQNCC